LTFVRIACESLTGGATTKTLAVVHDVTETLTFV
jgi:hypothetical protein